MATHDYYYEHEYHDYDTFYRRLSDPSEISSDSGGGPPTPDRVIDSVGIRASLSTRSLMEQDRNINNCFSCQRPNMEL